MGRFDFRMNGAIVTLAKAGVDQQVATEGIEQKWRPIANEFQAIEREIVRIQETAELTDVGRKVRLTALQDSRGRALVSKLDGSDLRVEHDELRALEDASEAGAPVIPPALTLDSDEAQAIIRRARRPERTAETAMDEREVRDYLRTLRPTDVQQRYLAAVDDGSDAVLVAAVERAPKAVPLVTADIITLARELRIQRSAQAETIAERRAFYAVHVTLLELAQLEAGALFPGLVPRGGWMLVPRPEVPPVLTAWRKTAPPARAS